MSNIIGSNVTGNDDLQSAGVQAPDPRMNQPQPDFQQDAGSLLRALSQGPMQQAQANPDMANWTGLAGFGAGMMGQANPVINQLQLAQEADRRQKMATFSVMEAVQHQRQVKANELKSLYQSAISSKVPTARAWGLKGIMEQAKSLGAKVDPMIEEGLLQGDINPQHLEEIAKMVSRQAPLEDITMAFPDIPQPMIQRTIMQYSQDPDKFLAAMGKKTLTQLNKEKSDEELKSLQLMKETQFPELKDPKIASHLIIEARRLSGYKKEYTDLSPEERNTVYHNAMKAIGDEAAAKAVQLQNELGPLKAQAKMDATLATFTAMMPLRIQEGIDKAAALQDLKRSAPGSAKGEFFMKNYPYEVMSPEASEADGLSLAQAGMTARVLNKGDQQSMKWVIQTKKALDAYRDAVRMSPDIFPPETGNDMQDLLNVGKGALAYKGLSRTDPRLAAIEGIKRHVMSIARLSGTGARLAQQMAEWEKDSAGFDKAATRGVKLSLANQVESFLNDQLTSMGFNPMPGYRQDGTLVWDAKTGKGYRVVPGQKPEPLERDWFTPGRGQ